MQEETTRKLVEVTFMSVDGVIDAPDIVREARQYFSSSDEHSRYQHQILFAADALLLGRKTYETFAKAYLDMAKTGKGAPMAFVERMNGIPKFVASKTLKTADWNATVIRGDIAEEVRKIKSQPGQNIVKYGTGPLDRVLFGQRLVDLLCILVYPFALGHGTHLFEGLKPTMHLSLSDVKRWENGTVVLEYVPRK